MLISSTGRFDVSRDLRVGFSLTVLVLVMVVSAVFISLSRADFSSSVICPLSNSRSCAGSNGRCFSLILPKYFLRNHNNWYSREVTFLSRMAIFLSLEDSSFSRVSIFLRSASCCSVVIIFLISYFDVKILKINDSSNSWADFLDYIRVLLSASKRFLRQVGFSIIPSTTRTRSRHAIVPDSSSRLIVSGHRNVPVSSSLEYITIPPGSQCKSLILLRALFMKIYTSPLMGSRPMMLVTIPLKVW